MQTKFIFIKWIFMGYAIILLNNSMYAQSKSVFHPFSSENNTLEVRSTLTSCDTISLEGLGKIYSLSINATIHQPQEASFSRVVLEDKDGHDYLVAESNWFRFDTTKVYLDHYCEETALLNGITPFCLKCYVTGDATITLTDINTSNQADTRNTDIFTEMTYHIKKDQVMDIVDRINSYNIKHGRLWRAAVTESSLLPYNEKKDKDEDDGCNSYWNNIQYYAGGFFEIGTPRAYADTTVSPYVPYFDWRHRHGKNWLTPPKRQRDSAYCTAFAAVGMLESNLLLHYKYNENDASAINLSEQYVASYVPISFKYGINTERPISFLKTDGTIDDASMPFVNDPNYTPPIIRPDGVEHVYLNDYDMINLFATPLDTIKKYLIHRGPGVGGYRMDGLGGHAMTLAGYGTVVPDSSYVYFQGKDPNVYLDTLFHEGDSIIGHTYWIYKNSRGPSKWYNGYIYIIYYNDDPSYMNSYVFFPKGKPRSNVSRPALCEDLDGDGYFNWGIDSISPGIAVWAQSDGDDSDSTIGHMNEFGYCEHLPADHPTYEYIYNDSTLTSSESRTSYLGVLNGATVTLYAQQNFANGTKLLLDNGATLVIDGISINGSFIQPYSGSKIILMNGAKILKPFTVPLGVELVIIRGSIE